MPKTILVTGSNSGLGKAIAIKSAVSGHKVYATMRNLQKRDSLEAEAAENGVSLEFRELDVQNSATVNSVMEEIIADHGKIDTLVCNAGAGFVRSTEQASENDIQWVLDVNFMGVARCVKAAMPHMRQARSGHVIAITSVGGLVGQPFNEFYCAAKFAVEGYIEALASYISPNFNIHFTAVEPGGISSQFAANVMAQIEQTGGMLDDEYLPILQRYVGGSQDRQAGDDIYQSAEEVADVVMQCVHSEDPPIRVRTSRWGEEFTKLKTSLDPDGKKQQKAVFDQFLK